MAHGHSEAHLIAAKMLYGNEAMVSRMPMSLYNALTRGEDMAYYSEKGRLSEQSICSIIVCWQIAKEDK